MYIDEKVLKVRYVGLGRKYTQRLMPVKRQVVIVHKSFVLNIVSTNVVAIYREVLYWNGYVQFW